MSVLTDYNEILENVQRAISDALNGELKSGLLNEIKKKAEENVYSYSASAWAMATRRNQIGAESNMDIEVGEDFIRITNVTQLQHPGGADESDVVEGGWDNYRQPGPREFMNPALDDFVGSGRADAILQDYLARYGVLF